MNETSQTVQSNDWIFLFLLYYIFYERNDALKYQGWYPV